MYSVFFVDDEALVITSLKACVDWASLGFSVMGEANDGISAYEMIISLKPDIVFVDIRMPGMNGLELIKKVYGENPHVLFIIISGYAEFAYVQKALSYGVLGYCLKPFDDDEILFLLAKARDALEKSKTVLEMELIGLIHDAENGSHIRINGILEKMGLKLSEDSGIVVAVSIGPEKLLIPKPMHHLCLKLGGNKIAYLFQDSMRDAFTGFFRDPGKANVSGIGLSRTCFHVDALSDAIEEACISANQYFMTGNGGIFTFAEFDQKQLNAVFSQLESAIGKRDISSIQIALNTLETELSKGVYNIRHAYRAYNLFMYSFCLVNTEKYESYLYDYEQMARSFDGLHDLFRFLKGLLHEYAGVKTGSQPTGPKSDTFSNILSYVNEHFCEDLSVHTISREVAVNPNYVSQLFKRQTGSTFTEYVTNLRVNLACSLLRTTDLTVAEVADKVGFNDYYYFIKVFRKMIGENPSPYRNRNLNRS